MNLTFSPLEGRSRSFSLLAIVLVVLSLAGLVSFTISYIQGHQVLGTGNVIPWGMPIVITIYLIGLSAGSLILSSLTYVFGKEEYRPISRLAVFLAILLIFGAMVGIAMDLGRPEKSWRLFVLFILNNMRSMFAINAILYGGYFVICLVYLGVLFAEKPKYPRTVAVIAIFWAALVHMGTGAIFGFIAARPIFYSPLKPLEFLGAAMASGLALLIVLVATIFRFAKRTFNVNILFSLGKLLLALIIPLFVLVFIDKLTHLYSADREPTLWLLTGDYAWIFWGFQVAFAYVLPMILLAHPRLKKTLMGVIGAALLVVIGVFGERFVLVIPGAAYPLPFYPGKIEGIWGALGDFPFTLVETLISLGIFALMGLFLVFGLKHLDLLPVYGGSEQGSISPQTHLEMHDGKAL